ncbi:MAG: hypothetical protein M3Z36_06520 [Acidobacteriota bacterium]|nr:hypothetical protein [Acidobacteriota bacterium]
MSPEIPALEWEPFEWTIVESPAYTRLLLSAPPPPHAREISFGRGKSGTERRAQTGADQGPPEILALNFTSANREWSTTRTPQQNW